MNDRSGTTDETLAAAIGDLAGWIDWPDAPEMATSVGAAIHAVETTPGLMAPRLSLPSRRRTLLLVAAAVLVVAGAALAARLAIEIGAVAVEVIPGRPTALPTAVARHEDLGRVVSVAEASEIVGSPAALPSALGPPDRTWVDQAAVGFEPDDVARRIVHAWRATKGLPAIPDTDTGAVLMQFAGEWQVASKLLSAETNRFGEAVVDGRPAFWTSGSHELTLVSGTDERTFLVTGNVLIWQDEGSTFRLETSLGKREATRIAESVQPIVERD